MHPFFHNRDFSCQESYSCIICTIAPWWNCSSLLKMNQRRDGEFNYMKKDQYADILKEKTYRKLLISNVINRFGDSIDAIAFTWLVYSVTGSAAWASFIYGLNLLPNIFLQPFFGPVVEKMNKKHVIVATHLLRGSVILIFSLIYMCSKVTPYLMAAFTLIITSVESFNLPAASSIIPEVLSADKLTKGLSLNSILSGMASLAGTGAAGIIIATAGVQTAMFLDVLSFFIAAGIVLSMKMVYRENTIADHSENYLSMLKNGVSYLIHNHILVSYCILAVGLNFFIVPLNALQGPIAKEIYGQGSELLSVIGMAESVGSILGSAAVPKLMERSSSKTIFFLWGSMIGISMIVLSRGTVVSGMLIPGLLLAGICCFVMGFSAGIMNGTVNIQFLRYCSKDYIARAGALLGAAAVAASPIASFLVSAASSFITTASLLCCSGIMAVLFIAVTTKNLKFEERKEKNDAG